MVYLKSGYTKKNVPQRQNLYAPLITVPPLTSINTFSPKEREKKRENKWHVTYDMWHMTFDKWQVTGWRRWTFSQSVSSLAVMVWELEVTCDTWHGTPDVWHLTPDMWHVTHDIWDVSRDTEGLMNNVSKFQLPSSSLIVWV